MTSFGIVEGLFATVVLHVGFRPVQQQLLNDALVPNSCGQVEGRYAIGVLHVGIGPVSQKTKRDFLITFLFGLCLCGLDNCMSATLDGPPPPPGIIA